MYSLAQAQEAEDRPALPSARAVAWGSIDFCLSDWKALWPIQVLTMLYTLPLLGLLLYELHRAKEKPGQSFESLLGTFLLASFSSIAFGSILWAVNTTLGVALVEFLLSGKSAAGKSEAAPVPTDADAADAADAAAADAEAVAIAGTDAGGGAGAAADERGDEYLWAAGGDKGTSRCSLATAAAAAAVTENRVELTWTVARIGGNACLLLIGLGAPLALEAFLLSLMYHPRSTTGNVFLYLIFFLSLFAAAIYSVHWFLGVVLSPGHVLAGESAGPAVGLAQDQAEGNRWWMIRVYLLAGLPAWMILYILYWCFLAFARWEPASVSAVFWFLYALWASAISPVVFVASAFMLRAQAKRRDAEEELLNSGLASDEQGSCSAV